MLYFQRPWLLLNLQCFKCSGVSQAPGTGVGPETQESAENLTVPRLWLRLEEVQTPLRTKSGFCKPRVSANTRRCRVMSSGTRFWAARRSKRAAGSCRTLLSVLSEQQQIKARTCAWAGWGEVKVKRFRVHYLLNVINGGFSHRGHDQADKGLTVMWQISSCGSFCNNYR